MTLSRADVICFSSIDWDFIWQGHQEVMAALAEQGNRVLFVDNTGVRSPVLRDFPRLRHRVRNWWRGIKGFRQEHPNLFVYSPLVLPFPYLRAARWVNRFLMLRALRRWMRATGFRPSVVWTFLPTQLVVDLIERLDPEVVVYYCIADFQQLAPPRKISRSERRLVRRTHVLFVQGEAFRERFAGHPNVHIFPFGVKMEAFEGQVNGAPELRSLKAPIIGYVGGIHQHLDQALIERVASEVGGTVVLVGPVQTDVGRLRSHPNVVFTGQQPHERIPEFIRLFDVGIIPYVRSRYTETVYPTKLNEYLAAGIPVIATDLPEVRRFNEEFGQVVTVARDAEDFAKAIREAARGTSLSESQRRIEIARLNSWESRIRRMSERVEQALLARRAAGERWEERFRRLYRQARRRLAAAAVGIVAFYLVLFNTPFIWYAGAPLQVAAAPTAADAIVVFAGGVGESGKAGGGYQERVKQAVTLYQGNHAPRIIFSSGYVFVFPEAEIMKGLATDLGVPASAIFLETKAANTRENIVFVQRILAESGWNRVLLVSSPYHMRRALLTWRKAAPQTTVIPSPVPESQFYVHGRGASLEQVRGILHEYLAILAYWWRGWI